MTIAYAAGGAATGFLPLNHPKNNQKSSLGATPNGLRFDGPTPKTPVLFGKKHSDKPSSLEAARQEANMLGAVPLLLYMQVMQDLMGLETSIEPAMIVNRSRRGLNLQA